MAQDKFDTYNSSYFNTNYDISISNDDKNSIKFWIMCSSMDKLSKQSLLLLNFDELAKFKTFVSSLKNTYSNWKKTAIDNKVTDLSKEVEYERLNFPSAFQYGKWHFDFSTNISAKFKIVDGKYLMIIKSDGLEASNNKYIKSDGFVIVFSSETEFDALLTKLDSNKALEYFNNKKSKEDLFKN
jgi:hypothetical protein